MNTKKLTLEDLKLESFLTELDESKLVKMQGGAGGYGGEPTDDSCSETDGGDECGNSGDCNSCDCQTDDYTNGPACNGDTDDCSVDCTDCYTENFAC